ncbi:Outer membrane protein TolC [Methylobacterium sp. 174MFSha1.1]|uniref:TolC family protein n=1 Tax=Methylobacterium sp. 174MFSha1.1 TaxID=1502749 RepID=UPI0008EA1D08|nr:TolC family protein [Methylobacterium sp. 174MFSha1.1]SFV06979.1 Outer membrane protein TolC [Methylobacterium sp. 174MFSha1.1]
MIRRSLRWNPLRRGRAWPNRPARAAATALVLTTLGACVMPEPVTEGERLDVAIRDLDAITASQAPIEGRIDLYGAMARALKYNLDRRIRLVEQFYASGEFDLAKYKLLPDASIGGGYLGRSNQAGSSSQSLLTGRQSLEPSTSLERNRAVADGRVLWSTLDFGVSYVKMQQDGNAVWLAREVERKTTSRILADTRRAYWRAYAAERIGAQLPAIADAANAAIRNARQAQARGDLTPEAALDFERRMLRTLREIERRQELMALSRAELAALISVDPAQPLHLSGRESLRPPPLPGDLVALRTVALMTRPELYEHDYKLRIARLERQIEILATLPGLRIDSGRAYDSNRYLYNNNWFDLGARLSLQLTQFISLPARLRQNETKQVLIEAQRRAMTLSVVTQVHLAMRAYGTKLRDFELARRILQNETHALTNVRANKEATTAGDASLIEARAGHALAALDYYYTFAELQEAYATVLTSLGVDVFPGAQDGDLPALTASLREFVDRGLPAALARHITEAREARRVATTGAIPPKGAGPASDPGAETAPEANTASVPPAGDAVRREASANAARVE